MACVCVDCDRGVNDFVEVLITSEVRGCVQTKLQIDGMGLFVTHVKLSDVDATCSLV